MATSRAGEVGHFLTVVYMIIMFFVSLFLHKGQTLHFNIILITKGTFLGDYPQSDKNIVSKMLFVSTVDHRL